jgi:hypothetical protein
MLKYRLRLARNFENDTLVDESIFIEDNARPVCMWIYQDSLYDCLSLVLSRRFGHS